MTASEAHASAAMNRNMGDAILAVIALEVLRKGPSLPAPIQFTRDVDYAEIPPAHVVDAVQRRGK